MALTIRLQPQDEALLERAASHLRVSKSEFIRRSVAAYVRQVTCRSPGSTRRWEKEASTSWEVRTPV